MQLLKLLLVSSLLIGLAFAKTYEIVEPDLLSEIEGKKNEIVKRVLDEEKKIERKIYSLKGISLPSSKKDYVYYIDPTYTLPKDIPIVKDGKVVGILYPKGYKLNPLEHIAFKPPPMIIFNACDDREIAIVERLMKEKHRLSYILVSGGCPIEQIKEKKVYNLLKHRIYLLTKELVDKLQLKNTVSFVDVDLEKKRIKIEVYKRDIH